MATIQGQCANCYLYFDVRNGLQCPHCKNQMAPMPHTCCVGETACLACAWLADNDYNKEAKPALDWLEHLYSLEDTRNETI